MTALNEFELEALLGISRKHNQADGITGLLMHITEPESGAGAFVQVLEGDQACVERAYARILADDLHGSLEVLAAGPAAQRMFGDWAMRLEQVASPVDGIRDREAMEALLARFAPR